MKKAQAIILSLSMAISIFAFASCSETPPEPATTAATTTEVTTPADTTTEATTSQTVATEDNSEAETTTSSTGSETTEASSADETTTAENSGISAIDLSGFDGYSKLPGYEDVDFGGRVFLVGLLEGVDSISFYSEDMDSISVSVRERNALVEKLYNCKIETDRSANPYAAATADVTGNVHRIDLYMSQSPSTSTAVNDQNYNLYNLGINFENPWWDASYVDTYTIDLNGVPTMYGAIGSFVPMTSVYVLYYNIDLYAQDELCQKYDLYQLVRDKKWTMDIFTEMIKSVKRDVNGNSSYSYLDGDIMGWIRTGHATHAMHVASNMRIVNNVDGKFEFAPATQTTEWATVIDKAIAVWRTEGSENVSYAKIPDYVASGKALFFSEILDTVKVSLKDADVSIGIVPYPLYSETQDTYCNYVDNHVADYHIPVSVPDPTTVATFLELVACHSMYTFLPAFLDAYAVEYFGDEESREMLEFIISNITYDPGYIWWSSYETDISNMIESGKNNITQWIGKKGASLQKNIDDFMAGIADNKN